MFTTLAELRSQVRTVLGISSGGGITDSQIDSYINQICRTWMPTTLVPTELQNHFTMTTSPDVGEYGLSQDMLSITGPTYADDKQLNLWFDEQGFFAFTGNRYDHPTQQPEHVLLFSNQMWFHPVPDAEYTIQTTALSRPAELVNDSDSIFDPSWALPVIYGAAGLLAYDLGDYDGSRLHLAMYDNAVLVSRREGLLRLTHTRGTPQW